MLVESSVKIQPQCSCYKSKEEHEKEREKRKKERERKKERKEGRKERKGRKEERREGRKKEGKEGREGGRRDHLLCTLGSLLTDAVGSWSDGRSTGIDSWAL